MRDSVSNDCATVPKCERSEGSWSHGSRDARKLIDGRGKRFGSRCMERICWSSDVRIEGSLGVAKDKGATASCTSNGSEGVDLSSRGWQPDQHQYDMFSCDDSRQS